ncbi:antiterminator Q family protein [Gilliamella sp. wkB308]|uniref:antiterminator Q family protein n=1 Tax=Gilliamella sp. wkB308 TaxID=3120263 RepID=UPI00080DB29A|nr:antiterminator Q family protein [Gilliamella apicola]OCG00171.1 hypothetical protein A9G10_00160 [Gilliamella apicola]
MTAPYLNIQENNKPKQWLNKVSLNADYDITQVLTRWGNWARKEAYQQRKVFSLYQSQKKEHKQVCLDKDGLIIDGIISTMKNSKIAKIKEEAKVLIKFYYGDEMIVDDHVYIEPSKTQISSTLIIKPKNLREIAQDLACSEGNIRKIKSSGESYIIGALSMQTMLTGTELELLQHLVF